MKSLREDSEFRIETEFGDALVSGNTFFVELYFDSFRNDYVFNVQNINGVVDLITKFSGEAKFGRNNMIAKKYDSEADGLQIVRIPPKQTVSIRKSSLSPGFRRFVHQFPKDAKSRLILDFENIEPFPMPAADQAIISNNT